VCDGHGTHVAGIIGANLNNPYGFSGVAYEASIDAYRVFDCDGSASEAMLIAGLLRADKDGNDVISMSAGMSDGWGQSASSLVANRIAGDGKIVVLSTGNSGDSGGWYTSGPASGLNVISVGSVIK
jgi:subtilisin family serine protease